MKIHLLHKAETAVLSRSSTKTKINVEDLVQVKDKFMAVAIKIKSINSSNLMMHRDQTHMDMDSLEVGGEVTKISKEIIQIMITENVRVVVGQVILNVTVHHEIRVVEDSKTIMRQPAEIQMIQRGCLSCNTCQTLCLQMYQSVLTMYGMWIRVLRIT